MGTAQVIQAELTWTGDRFERDIQVVVNENGCIEHVGHLDLKPTDRWTDYALLPGMINAHSHAFQRGLRGQGESFPETAGSFWSWREAMYHIVQEMDADRFHTVSLAAFQEMRACGITTVGEFHYLHHEASRDGYPLDDIILTAAHDAGIRLVLLHAYYNTGDIGKPMTTTQRQFASESVSAYWKQMDRLAHSLRDSTQTLGTVAHSIRAATLEDIEALHREARSRGMVFHIHVEEQQREIQSSLDEYGQTPLSILNRRLSIDQGTTAIHCTHSDPKELEKFVAAGGNVCICPLTEGNLGDGIADVPTILDAGGHLCVGTDSNARICLTEELRWLEYVQRLSRESRGICRDSDGQVDRLLWFCATSGGARSLGVHTGKIAPGYCADFIALDLNSAQLAYWTEATLLGSFIFGADGSSVTATCVSGRWSPPPSAFSR